MKTYRSCIENEKKYCNTDQFIKETNHSIREYDVRVIFQLENVLCNEYQVIKRKKKKK